MIRVYSVAFLVATLVLLSASTAPALEKCKAKIKAKDGTIEVSAKNVQGALTWGSESGQEITAFFNDATCVVGGSAKKCVFGDQGTLARITPPSGCTVYLKDGVGPSCSAFIKKCTPGARQEASAAICEKVRGTTSCDLEEVIATVGNCTAKNGVVVGGACWFRSLPGPGQGCDATCSGAGLVYDDATRFFAGSDGTDARCTAVLDALGAPGTGLGTPATSQCGCYVAGILRNRATVATDSTCSAAGFERACACK